METRHAAQPRGPDAAREVLLAGYRQALSLLERLADGFRAQEAALSGASLAGAPEDVPPTARLTDAQLTLLCLGPFRIRIGDALVDLGPGGKPLAILKFLATRGPRPTPRDVLLEAIWPETAADTAANRLRVAVHELRRLLDRVGAGPGVVGYRHGCYVLRSGGHSGHGGHISVDAEQFETLWHRGLALEREGQRAAAMAAYRQAEALYGGDYLQEDLYEDWTLLRREALRDAHLDMLGKLAAWCLAAGQHHECMVESRKLLLEDACREDAYHMLMRCHAATGHPAQAHRWYELCVKTLRRELNTAPSPETVALYEQLLAAGTPTPPDQALPPFAPLPFAADIQNAVTPDDEVVAVTGQ